MWFRPGNPFSGSAVNPLALRVKRSRRRFVLYGLAALGFLLLFAFLLLLLLNALEGYFQRPLEGLRYYAYGVVFLVTLISSASIVLPIPGLPLVLVAASTWDPFWVAVAASMGSVLGESTGYILGRWGGRAIAHRAPQIYQKAEGWMKRYGMGAVFFFALVPFMVFDFVGIAAGALRLPLWKFFLAAWAGRLPRAFIEVYFGGEFFKWLLNWLQ